MRRHDLDPFSLGAGVLFLLVAGTHLVAELTDRELHGQWVLPAVLIALGLAGLAGAFLGKPDRPRAEAEPPAQDEVPEEPAEPAELDGKEAQTRADA